MFLQLMVCKFCWCLDNNLLCSNVRLDFVTKNVDFSMFDLITFENVEFTAQTYFDCASFSSYARLEFHTNTRAEVSEYFSGKCNEIWKTAIFSEKTVGILSSTTVYSNETKGNETDAPVSFTPEVDTTSYSTDTMMSNTADPTELPMASSSSEQQPSDGVQERSLSFKLKLTFAIPLCILGLVTLSCCFCHVIKKRGQQQAQNQQLQHVQMHNLPPLAHPIPVSSLNGRRVSSLWQQPVVPSSFLNPPDSVTPIPGDIRRK